MGLFYFMVGSILQAFYYMQTIGSKINVFYRGIFSKQTKQTLIFFSSKILIKKQINRTAVSKYAQAFSCSSSTASPARERSGGGSRGGRAQPAVRSSPGAAALHLPGRAERLPRTSASLCRPGSRLPMISDGLEQPVTLLSC